MVSLWDKEDGLTVLLTLIISILICIHEKWVTYTITRTWRALPPAKWRKWTTGFIGLCNSVAWHIRTICVSVFLEWQGYPKRCAGSQNKPNREYVAKAPHCDWPRDSVHPWYRLLQERVLLGPKRVPVCFWHSCLGDGGASNQQDSLTL